MKTGTRRHAVPLHRDLAAGDVSGTVAGSVRTDPLHRREAGCRRPRHAPSRRDGPHRSRDPHARRRHGWSRGLPVLAIPPADLPRPAHRS